MDPTTNPYAPGAGTQPPELAGRDEILQDAEVALARVKDGRAAQSQLLLGLRGVGKTVLLNRIGRMAEEKGYLVALVEAPEGRPLPELLAPMLRRILLQLDGRTARKEQIRHGLRVLRNFASIFKVKMGDFEASVEPAQGEADSGLLDADLGDLLLAVAAAAQSAATPVAILIDELQYLATPDLAALIVALHRLAQRGLPLMVFGAGLPQLAGLAGDTKSYAERLFTFPAVGPLDEAAATAALREPARRQGVDYTDEALRHIVATTEGYPYFIQTWGAQAWRMAAASPITLGDAKAATVAAIEQLDRSFFRVRFDRLTPRERTYLRAMAELGAGPHRSGAVARRLGIPVRAAAPIRQVLIAKGMVYSPAHGLTAFTVPMFDAYLRRTMPARPALKDVDGARAKSRRRPK